MTPPMMSQKAVLYTSHVKPKSGTALPIMLPNIMRYMLIMLPVDTPAIPNRKWDNPAANPPAIVAARIFSLSKADHLSGSYIVFRV